MDSDAAHLLCHSANFYIALSSHYLYNQPRVIINQGDY